MSTLRVIVYTAFCTALVLGAVTTWYGVVYPAPKCGVSRAILYPPAPKVVPEKRWTL